MKAWLRLARIPLAPTAATDALAVGLLAHQAAGADVAATVWWAVGAAAVATYVLGMVLNDWADRHVDATSARERPLPSGAVRPPAALALALAAAAAALGAAVVAGSWPAVAAALALAALYDLGAKRHDVGGAVVLGLARSANAAQVPVALLLAGQGTALGLAAALVPGVYAAAITLHSTNEEHVLAARGPRYTIPVRALASGAFAGAALLALVARGGITLGALLAVGVITSTAFGRTPRKGSIKRQVLEMLLGFYVLAYVLASGTLAGDWVVAIGGLALAWLLILGSQVLVRALR